VDGVLELLTMAVGPESLMVAARVNLAKGLTADRVERVADEIERDVRRAVPTVSFLFLDPTPPRGADRALAEGEGTRKAS
jgi:hypothetical protein